MQLCELAMLNLPSILAELAAYRPVFYSEADFQHALAWAVHKSQPDASIRLEKRIAGQEAPVYLDLLIRSAQGEFALELKYKTRAFSITHQDENFDLRTQGDCAILGNLA